MFESSFFIISKIHLNSHYHSHNVKNHFIRSLFCFYSLFVFAVRLYTFLFFLLTYFLFLFQLALQLTALFNDLYENAYITTYTYIFYTEIALILFSWKYIWFFNMIHCIWYQMTGMPWAQLKCDSITLMWLILQNLENIKKTLKTRFIFTSQLSILIYIKVEW